MKKPLSDILSALPYGIQSKNRSAWDAMGNSSISTLRYDSRLAAEGTLFFCLVGKTVDGHKFAPAAYRNGCRAFVVQEPVALPEDAVQLVVPDTRAALADCAAAFYDHPERQVRLVGLTGTKGKTTTALLIQQILNGAGIPAGYIGTNGVHYRNYRFETVNSTPESAEIYRYLRDMLEEGVRVCVLEVSSQALWMERVRGLRFDTVLFTNLSRDHIGGVEHPDFEHYRDCKRRLFSDYPAEAVIVNRNDPASAYMTDAVTVPLLGFGLSGSPLHGDKPLWSASQSRLARSGNRIGVEFDCCRNGLPVGERWFLPMPGEFNIQNALAALTVVCERFGVPPTVAKELLKTVAVDGRFETVTHPSLPDVTFVIDYAHNGMSLAAILDALRAYEPTRLICLFGSVGGRTVERRRDLALAAAHRCELCILTSDNPASESPMDIIADIDAAFPADACPRLWEPDRAEAIRKAVDMAQAGDIILLAGKGHEAYQLIGTQRVPFSEIRILEEAICERVGAGVGS